MSLENGTTVFNNSSDDKIDFQFYDSDFEACEEDIGSGVNKVQIKPVNKSNSEEIVRQLNNETNLEEKDNNITKCIAYELGGFERTSPDLSYNSDHLDGEVSPTLDVSLSPSSPSDLTTVTPLTSSSSYSSLKEKFEDDYSTIPDDSSKNDLKLLSEAVETLSVKNKKPPRRSAIPVSISSCSTLHSSKQRRKNMTFTNDELRKIERENEILLRKIMAQSKPRSKSLVMLGNTQPRTVKASAAVNRSKKQREINRDNYILYKKIQNVKATHSSNI